MNNKSATELFNEYLQDMGGRLDPSLIPPNTARVLEHHRNLAEQWIADVKREHLPNMPDIHFDYIDSLELNACAFSAEGRGFIGINAGTVALIYILFRRMLADPNILPSIGNVHTELSDPPLFNALQLGADHSAFLHASIIPKDPVRQSYAHLLAELALDFLFAHEYGHISNGHVYFNSDTTGQPFIVEIRRGISSGQADLTSQTLEMDADCDAVLQGLEKIFGRIRDIGMIREDWRPFYGDFQTAFFTWAFSFYSLFRLFGSEPINFSEAESASHPPPSIRRMMAYATAYEILIKRGDEKLLADFTKVIGDVIGEVERAFAQISGQPINTEGALDGTSPNARLYASRLLSHWQVIRPKLEPLAQSNLAP
jgi:hypothetical protein